MIMCTYMGQRVSQDRMIRLKQLERMIKMPDFNRPVQNGFDYMDWPVIASNEDYTDWDFEKMEWGFIPFYLRNRDDVNKFRKGYTDEKGKFHKAHTTLNAKGEELLLPGKMYREAALKRRCLIPASFFYEWQHVFPVGKRGQKLKTAVKYPYVISIKDTDCFLIAGVWQPWTDKNTGEMVNTFALITTDANSLMKQIHNSKERMPTILPVLLAEEWLSKDLSEKRITELATYQIDSSSMIAHTVRKDFRELEDPLEHFAYAELPELNR